MININIYLIGMMGSGKSTIGRILADRLNMSWVDMDDAIEAKGMKIPEIFEKHGENKFRDIESQVTAELANSKSLVVSTGGGVILRSENVGLMRTSGKTVYLQADKSTLIRNLTNGRDHRPLLKDGSLEKKIDDLMVVRANKYISSADLVIETKSFSPHELCDQIVKLLKL